MTFEKTQHEYNVTVEDSPTAWPLPLMEEPMSKYQYLAFRAIDKAVSEKNLKFMRQQSSRAEITPWSFDNEYQYGDFHGDAAEMLRRGYDFHLHYANFGIRTLMIRLPNGLPDPPAAQAYFDKESLTFSKDKQGPGGILGVEPFYEPGDLEDLWELDALFERLLPLRARNPGRRFAAALPGSSGGRE
jgi:hypothetical protein